MILIKGMEMPQECDQCPFFDDRFDYPSCNATGYSKGYNWNPRGQRMPDCPLIEVPAWIPVAERLPNRNGEYLVSGKGKVWVCEFMIFGDIGGWCNSAMNPCVEYWMPLPKPLKDGGS